MTPFRERERRGNRGRHAVSAATPETGEGQTDGRVIWSSLTDHRPRGLLTSATRSD